jgi:hypothetical protein
VSNFNLLGLGVLLILLALYFIYAFVGRRYPAVFRSVKGYEGLGKAVEQAVEAGERVHVSLGTGSVIGSDSAPALAGMVILSRIATATSTSDKPVSVTTGDGAMALLAQDVLRTAYSKAAAADRFRSVSARMLGPTPYSYAAGLPILLSSEGVSVHVLAGSFGAEGALAADFGQRHGAYVLAGTDDVQSQALLYATADETLIGEELFAGGAYLNMGPLHRASLRVQDTARVLIVIVILVGILLGWGS